MKQIVLFLILILFSCKGQSVDTLEEIKNQEPITIEVLGQKIKTDSLGVNIFIPKRYLLNSKNMANITNAKLKDFVSIRSGMVVSKTANNFTPKTTISTNKWKPSSCKLIKVKGTVIVLIFRLNGKL